ncbi:countin2 [Cavenderia fasciculata]|uniref:Countin2 n=1 Tax=Cavenderia fasciculata TaxID=261658 RepID=F4PSN0_CACFS|nr:countin2 [Cavenderia fasciculata]EGG20722.1 countin2 [Cavenderia fasciculata]|eukprot:XP_004358572.1 countin2 [Cavenderia fasciculata]
MNISKTILLSIIFAILLFNAGNNVLANNNDRQVVARFGADTVDVKSEGAPFTTCNDCVSIMTDTIDDLIGILMNSGVMASCNDLCSRLSNHYENIACMLTCVYFGLEEFSNLVLDADPDPIFMCEVIDVCPVKMTAAGNITNFDIVPSSGPVGTTFYANINYTITSEIGTGQIVANLYDTNNLGFGFYNLLVDTAPGDYYVSFPFQSQPSEMEPFNPGSFLISVGLCEGFCGSIHKYTIILSVVNDNFTISSNTTTNQIGHTIYDLSM